jgi:surfactin synthase thioesterase subunit
VLTIAAVLGPDPDSGGIAAQPEALFAASLGALNETEIAVLLAQLDVAVLTVLSQMAPHTEMGEDAFRRIVNTARKSMLDAEGLDLCDECAG